MKDADTIRDYQQELFDLYPAATFLPVAELLETIRVGLLEDEGFQRPLDKPRALKMAANFDPYAVGYLMVNERENGSHWLFQGQHRAYAMSVLGITLAPCHIVSKLDRDREADLFVKISTAKPVSQLMLYHGDLEANKQDVVAINSAVSSFGYFVPRFHGKANAKRLTCVSTLRAIYRQGGAPVLRQVLGVVHRAWSGKQYGTDARVILGVHIFMAAFRWTVDEDHLVKCLSKLDPADLIAQSVSPVARSTYEGGVKRVISHLLLKEYNKGRPANMRLSHDKLARFHLANDSRMGGGK